ncbi:MAG: hypothetical protein ABWZ66_12695 [Pyrinomonadaceae bacterium]
MKHKIFALFIILAFALSAFVSTFAQTKTSKNQLAALLPASDGVVSVDTKRLFGGALPQILSGNKEMLGEINAKIDEFKTNTSIDIRQFDQIAVGIATRKISETDMDFEPLVLARGSFNASSLVTLAKFASKDAYREEKIGSRTVYIFSAKEIIEKNKTAVKSSFIQKILDKILPGLSGETAVTVYDNNTLAFGKYERLKLLLTDSKSRVDAGLLALVNRHPNAVASFAMNLPNGMSSFLELTDDELGQNLDSIRQIHGMFDVVGENTSVSVSGKTLKPEQAASLKESFDGLQGLFSGILLGSKSENQKLYGRMLKSAKISRVANEITIDLQVPQSDINILVGAK